MSKSNKIDMIPIKDRLIKRNYLENQLSKLNDFVFLNNKINLSARLIERVSS